MTSDTEGGSWLPIEVARRLIARPGRKPPARATLLGLAARRELRVELHAGRYVVSLASLHSYRERNGIEGAVADPAAA